MQCKQCGTETSNPSYCSRSCAATVNNTGRRRHGSAKGDCAMCGKPKASAARKYCSQECSSTARKKDQTYINASNAARQARYRAKHGYVRAYAPNANKEVIKQIYANVPEGHEVDHIIPLSKGGLHHEDNLQYLTVKENRQKGSSSPVGSTTPLL